MIRRVLIIATTLLLATLSLATPALAGPEWCDNGSPPPNDFRLRPTGAPSAGATPGWLASATGGTIELAAGINTLVGGVAHGMTEALDHARPFSTLPQHE